MPGSTAYTYRPTGIMQPEVGFPMSVYTANPYFAPPVGSTAPGSQYQSSGSVPYYSVDYGVPFPNTAKPTAAGGAGTLGTTVGGAGQGQAYDYTSAYGGKPYVPDPNKTAAEAIGGNIANYPAINTLATDINQGNLDTVLRNVGANIPNYSGLVGQRSGNIASELAGEVPMDVQNLLQTQAAQRGIALGIPGSQAGDYSFLESLGLTSLGQKKLGSQELGSALQTMPNVPIYDPSKMMTSPEDIQASEYARNVIAAAPSPKAAADEAFNKMLQLRALAEEEQNALANNDFMRQAELMRLRAALTGRPGGGSYPLSPQTGPSYTTSQPPAYGMNYQGRPPTATGGTTVGSTGPLTYAPTYEPQPGGFDPFSEYMPPTGAGYGLDEAGYPISYDLNQYLPNVWGVGGM